MWPETLLSGRGLPLRRRASRGRSDRMDDAGASVSLSRWRRPRRPTRRSGATGDASADHAVVPIPARVANALFHVKPRTRAGWGALVVPVGRWTSYHRGFHWAP